MNIKVLKNQEGFYGAIDVETGLEVLPFIYDQITLMDNKEYICRIWYDYDIRDLNGKIKMISRRRHWWEPIKENAKNTSEHEDISRDGLENPPDFEHNGLVEFYRNGKFGVRLPDGTTILEPLYDHISRWPDCDVIEAKIGRKYLFFNLRGERILTKYLYGPYSDWNHPYSLGVGDGDPEMIVIEPVDSVCDEECCVCYGHPVRMTRMKKADVEPLLNSYDAIFGFEEGDFYWFTHERTYFYLAYKVRGGTIDECINTIRKIGGYSRGWNVIDFVLTHPDTQVEESEVDKLFGKKIRHFYAQDHIIGYGTSHDFPRGQVEVFHILYYYE